MSPPDIGLPGPREFPATSWSALLELKDAGSPEYQRNLRRLIELYWKPVYWVVRRSCKSSEDAEDLTQEFFADAVLGGNIVRNATPDRGSFRAFLRGAITNFLHSRARHAGRQKRGGRAEIVSIDDETRGQPLVLPDPSSDTPEKLFDAAWNQVVIEQALVRLETRLKAEGKSTAYEIFRRYDLDRERKDMSYADLGAPFGMGIDQVKRALTHARGCLRQALTEIVREYVHGPEELAAELRHLLGG